MSATQKQYSAAQSAIRAWLNANEGFYSGMISDQLLASVVKVGLDAAILAAIQANTAPSK